LESLDGLLAQERSRASVPGFSVAVVKGGRVCWMKGFGFADIATHAPATPETVYMWFSMTKIVTATAVMQLHDQGRLGLDDPVKEYIPNFPTAPDSTLVTLRHLLNHSSGLPNPIPIRWVHVTTETGPDAGAFLNQLLAKYGKLRSKPGRKASYSNIGYVALGEVIAVASGERYQDYVMDRILKPLGMKQTNFIYTPGMLLNAATGYQKRLNMMTLLLRFMGVPRGVLNGRVGNYVAFNRFYLDGASYGGLLGPVKDVARFLQVHLNRGLVDGKQILSPDSVAMMQEISARGGKLDVGLGWYRQHPDSDGKRTFLEHLGGGAGFFNDMRIYPAESLGVVVMGNSTKYDIERIIEDVQSTNWN
jgi:CubicO group peptidase (beta-lactamase class C family)